MVVSQAARNYGGEGGLSWYLRWEIYTSIATCNKTKNSPAVAKAPSLKHLSNNHRDHPNLPENSHKLYDEMGILF